MDISNYTLEQLKSLAYDLLLAISTKQKDLKIVEDMIQAKLSEDKITEDVDKKD